MRVEDLVPQSVSRVEPLSKGKMGLMFAGPWGVGKAENQACGLRSRPITIRVLRKHSPTSLAATMKSDIRSFARTLTDNKNVSRSGERLLKMDTFKLRSGVIVICHPMCCRYRDSIWLFDIPIVIYPVMRGSREVI